MQKRETLAQLIYRTVLEFEQRQAQEVQQQTYVESFLPDSNITVANQSLAKNNSKAKQINSKKSKI